MKRNLTVGASSAGRRGFTLPEILVVLTIIAVLVALLSAAAAKFRDAQIANSTDARLMRFQQKLNADYGEVLQKCQKDRPPDALVTFCGTVELARSVHTAATLKANFPETFQEAANPTPFGPFSYPAKKTFASVSGVAPLPTTATPPQRLEREYKERAILLYLILTERSTGGTGGGDESGSPGELRTESFSLTTPAGATRDFTYYVDLYGQPITYYRWGWANGTPPNNELNGAPYTTRTSGNRDPFDSRELVALWTPTNPPETQATIAQITQIQTALNFNTRPAGWTAGTPYSNNRIPTVVSFGRDKQFNNFGENDRVGYRLNRLGGKGSKGDDEQ